MNDSTMTVTIPLDVYKELIHAQAIVDILRAESREMSSYDFTSFAARLLGASAPKED